LARGAQPSNPTIGFLLDGEIGLPLSDAFGLALHAYADFNHERSFGGVAIGLELGKLR
jgi:hypothetical protein